MVLDPIERNNVRAAGHGQRTMVFGHGFGSDQRAWRFVAPAFAAGYREVLFDHVGFGGSRLAAYDADRHASLHGYVGDLLEILDTLGGAPVVHVGHSAGAVIGLLASLVRPERFAGLVLLGMSPRFLNDAAAGYEGGFEPAEIEAIFELMERDRLAWAGALAPMAMGEGSPAGLVQDFHQGLAALDPLVARRFGRLAFGVDCRAELKHVAVPTLIVQCRHDRIVPPAVGRYLQQQIAGSVLHEIDGAGHCPHISHPAQTVAAMQSWLAARGF